MYVLKIIVVCVLILLVGGFPFYAYVARKELKRRAIEQADGILT